MKITYIRTFLILIFASFKSAHSVNFNQDIRPILADRCFHCHGPDEHDRKAKLRLDSGDGDEGAFRVYDGIQGIYPGSLEKSEVWYRIITEDEDEIMPPPKSHKKPLSKEEKGLIKEWILSGAEYEDFWAFVEPKYPDHIKASKNSWSEKEIDKLVYAKLQEKSLNPSPEADKRTLIRRATFDLTGLPPTQKEIQAFLEDNKSGAYVRLVDRLLQKKQYGEHMAKYWLDLVRFADSNGMHKDFYRNFHRYRSWVIQAFNRNLSFDNFVKYQVAGDLYPEPSTNQLIASGYNRLHLIIDKGTALPEESLHKNISDKVEAFGTVFLGLTVQCASCHDHKYDPITQKEYYQLYAFFNNFSGAPETVTGRGPKRGLQPPFIDLPTKTELQEIDQLNKEIEQLKKTVDALAEKNKGALSKDYTPWGKEKAQWVWTDKDRPKRKVEKFLVEFDVTETIDDATFYLASHFTAELTINGKQIGSAYALNAAMAKNVTDVIVPGKNIAHITVEYPAKMGDTQKKKRGFLFELYLKSKNKVIVIQSDKNVKVNQWGNWKPANVRNHSIEEESWFEYIVTDKIATLYQKKKKLESRIEEIHNAIDGVMYMDEMSPIRPAYLLARGSYEEPRDRVYRGTPAFLPPLEKPNNVNRPYSRMDLAKWLVDGQHPLTARVAVNRFWQQLFGVGLVKTSEDFGAQGEVPSHPKLLDYLAVQFMKSGWNIKELMKEIVLSKTYKQRSNAKIEAFEKDPENRMLARGSRFRMDSEMIRDQILLTSGKLNTTMYGPSVKPPQPEGLWQSVSMIKERYFPDKGPNRYRRSLYTFWKRGMPPPQMTILNAPNRDSCIARRERTNTPLQALLLLNEPEYLELSKNLVLLTMNANLRSKKKQIEWIYERITSKLLTKNESKNYLKLIKDLENLYSRDQSLTDSITEGITIEKKAKPLFAAWTIFVNTIYNLDIVKTRQ